MSEDFAPQCMKCGSRHYFSQPCISNAPVYSKREFVVASSSIPEGVQTVGYCSDCQLKDRRINELEAKLEKGRSARRNYQREYMRKRRAK